jgi:hypothetical protein
MRQGKLSVAMLVKKSYNTFSDFVIIQSQANLIKICAECMHRPDVSQAKLFVLEFIWRIHHIEETHIVFEIGSK